MLQQFVYMICQVDRAVDPLFLRFLAVWAARKWALEGPERSGINHSGAPLDGVITRITEEEEYAEVSVHQVFPHRDCHPPLAADGGVNWTTKIVSSFPTIIEQGGRYPYQGEIQGNRADREVN